VRADLRHLASSLHCQVKVHTFYKKPASTEVEAGSFVEFLSLGRSNRKTGNELTAKYEEDNQGW